MAPEGLDYGMGRTDPDHTGNAAAAARQHDKRSRQTRKHRRAAEARQRFELLEEERELKDNLAEFWDERLDKPRKRRVPLPPWDVHKTLPSALETGANGAEGSREPRRRSER